MTAAREQAGDLLKEQRKGLTNPPSRRPITQEEIARTAQCATSVVAHLEQGRPQSVGSETLLRIAQAYHLTAEKTQALFSLLGINLPSWLFVPWTKIDRDIQQLLNDLRPLPAVIVDCRMDILGWNNEACFAFLKSIDSYMSHERNLLYFLFNYGPEDAQRFLENYNQHARELVEEFRKEWASHPGDDRLEQVLKYASSSNEFLHLWQSVTPVPSGPREKVLLHPVVGRLALIESHLLLADAATLRLILYRPFDQSDRDKLERLSKDASTAFVLPKMRRADRGWWHPDDPENSSENSKLVD